MKDFKQKVVVITGAGAGMGRSYALEFARAGAKLALNDFDGRALDATLDLLHAEGHHQVVARAFDVADADAMRHFANEVESVMGPASIVINNAGIEGAAVPAWDMPDTAYERVMKVNVFGVINGTRAFLPQLMKVREAAIVNVSSIFGLIGTPNNTDYCASKFAVRGFTEALMVELQDSHIQVHLVHPGGINTSIARSERSQAFAKHYLTTPPEAMVRRVMRGIRRNEARIVYGRDAHKAWLGALLVPLPLLKRIIWRDMSRHLDNTPYRRLRAPHPG